MRSCIRGAVIALVLMFASPVVHGDLVDDGLRVTEIMYHPIDGRDFEYLEFFNAGAGTLDLSGVQFVVGIVFTVPAGTMLASGEYLVIAKNLDAFVSKYGSGLRAIGDFPTTSLNNGGEQIVVWDSANTTIMDFEYNDAGEWPFRADGQGSSLERFDNSDDFGDPETWRDSVQFNGSPGRAGLAPSIGVVINEVLTHTDPPLEDAIELFNPTIFSFDVGGWFLSDAGGDDRRKFRIPDGATIGPDEYLVYYERDFNFNNPLDRFALSSVEDQVHLAQDSPSGQVTIFADSVQFGGGANAISFGRHQTSAGVDFTALRELTFGSVGLDTLENFRTGAGAPNSPPLVGPIVINEIMYHPPDVGGLDDRANEYIELHNISDQAIELWDPIGGSLEQNGWRLRRAVDFEFAEGTTIPPEGFLLVVSFDPAIEPDKLVAFRSTYGLGPETPVVGGWGINERLNNSGERIRLNRPDEPTAVLDVARIVIDEVFYRDDDPWPDEADGEGVSLERIDAAAYGNEPLNWSASGPTPGAINIASQNRTGPLWSVY